MPSTANEPCCAARNEKKAKTPQFDNRSKKCFCVLDKVGGLRSQYPQHSIWEGCSLAIVLIYNGVRIEVGTAEEAAAVAMALAAQNAKEADDRRETIDHLANEHQTARSNRAGFGLTRWRHGPIIALKFLRQIQSFGDQGIKTTRAFELFGVRGPRGIGAFESEIKDLLGSLALVPEAVFRREAREGVQHYVSGPCIDEAIAKLEQWRE